VSTEAPRALHHVWLGAVPHADARALQQRVAHARASGELDGDCLLLLERVPGQLVAYPIVRLADALPIPGHPGQGDVVRYVRALEEGMLAAAAAAGVTAGLRPPYTGIWVGDDKLGAIGVKLARGVTQHGVAINVTTDLRWFAEVVACGIPGAGVTSLERLGVEGWTPQRLAPELADGIAAALGLTPAPADRRLVDLATHAAV